MKLYYLICFHLIRESEMARILCIYPTPSISHQVALRPLALELARRSHELVVLTADPVYPKGQSPENYIEIDVHDMSYDLWKNGFLKEKIENFCDQLRVAFHVLNQVYKKELLSEEFQKILKNEKKFDLLIIESVVKPFWVLGNIFKAPVVLLSSLGIMRNEYDTVGASIHPFLYPTLTQTKMNNLTYWEKLKVLHHNYNVEKMWTEVGEEDNAIVKSVFGPNVPDRTEISDNVALLILNTHAIWDNNRPVGPNVIYAGGMHQKPEEELPSDLKTFLDSSKHGVIYISFGTNVIPSLLPPEWIQILIKVFSQLPYDVLWKWDKDELPGKTENIKISKWLPQSDLLRHPKVKLFITQCGLQSSDEAITAGVPLIGIPMLGDQWYNAEQYVKHKIGLRLDVEDLSEEKLRSYIEEIIGDDSYRQNIARLRDQMYDQPQTSLERAVWWTEHVLRHGGGKHLRPAGANLTWSQYLELPFVLTLLLSAIVILALVISAVLYLCRLFRRINATVKFKKV